MPGMRRRQRGDLEHVNDRVGIPRATKLSAGARIRRTGERQEGRFRRAQRERREGLRRLLGASSRATRSRGTSRSPAVARRIERAVLQVVRRRRAQRLVQLPRPQSRERQRRQGRDHLRGRRRRPSPRSRISDLYHRVCRLANGLQVARHPEGRSRHHLHADVDRRRGRDAGVRAHRRDAFGGLRRLLREVAAGADRRRRRGRGDHRRRAGARRQAPAAEGDRRRGARDGRLRERSAA